MRSGSSGIEVTAPRSRERRSEWTVHTTRRLAVEDRDVFYWPQARLAVEVDGAAFHHTRRAFYADRARDRALAALGVQVLRVTWRDLDRGEELAGELQGALAARTG